MTIPKLLVYKPKPGINTQDVVYVLFYITLWMCSCDAVPATLGIPCWADVCEFHMSLTLGHTLTRTHPGGHVKDLELHPGGCLKLANAEPTSPCIDVTANEASSRDITADGRQRSVLLVNGQFPGPSLEVMEGSTVIVKVTNDMKNINTDIHWHGVTQEGTQWSDGAAFITQCPIPPGHTFTYRFKATPTGTLWYHPHLNNLRSDGHYGLIIIHKARPVLTELPLIISDWFLEDGLGEPLPDLRAGTSVVLPNPVSSLINGRGQHGDVPHAPSSKFQIESGKTYRFRCVNSASDLSYEISIDQHPLTILAWDGADIEPIEVDSFNIFPAERVDFEIQGQSNTDPSWIRAASLVEINMHSSGGTEHGGGHGGMSDMMNDTHNSEINPLNALAILSYQANSVNPTSQPRHCTSDSKCKVFNCFRAYSHSENKTCIDLKDIHTTELDQVSTLTSNSPAKEIILNVATTLGASIGGKRFISPMSPFYQSYPQDLISCQDKCTSHHEICSCSHKLVFYHNELVQLVFSNIEPNISGSTHGDAHGGPGGAHAAHTTGHPMHVHGQRFAVVAQGFAQYDPHTGMKHHDTKSIMCNSDVCMNPTWNPQYPIGDLHLNNPPLKDTVILPPGGYVVLRLRNANPGYWLLHCHLLKDQIDGMQLYIEVSPEKVQLPPSQLPPCSPYAKDTFSSTSKAFRPNVSLSPLELLGLVVGSVGTGVLLVVSILLCSRLCRVRRASKSPVIVDPSQWTAFAQNPNRVGFYNSGFEIMRNDTTEG